MKPGKPSWIDRLVLVPNDPRVRVDNVQVILPAQELALLRLFVKEAGRFVTTATAARHLARGRNPLREDAVFLYVHRLRARLEPAGFSIRSLRGFGYTLEPIERRNREEAT